MEMMLASAAVLAGAAALTAGMSKMSFLHKSDRGSSVNRSIQNSTRAPERDSNNNNSSNSCSEDEEETESSETSSTHHHQTSGKRSRSASPRMLEPRKWVRWMDNREKRRVSESDAQEFRPARSSTPLPRNGSMPRWPKPRDSPICNNIHRMATRYQERKRKEEEARVTAQREKVEHDLVHVKKKVEEELERQAFSTGMSKCAEGKQALHEMFLIMQKNILKRREEDYKAKRLEWAAKEKAWFEKREEKSGFGHTREEAAAYETREQKLAKLLELEKEEKDEWEAYLARHTEALLAAEDRARINQPCNTMVTAGPEDCNCFVLNAYPPTYVFKDTKTGKQRFLTSARAMAMAELVRKTRLQTLSRQRFWEERKLRAGAFMETEGPQEKADVDTERVEAANALMELGEAMETMRSCPERPPQERDMYL
jgi:hypothetical protein